MLKLRYNFLKPMFINYMFYVYNKNNRKHSIKRIFNLIHIDVFFRKRHNGTQIMDVLNTDVLTRAGKLRT